MSMEQNEIQGSQPPVPIAAPQDGSSTSSQNSQGQRRRRRRRKPNKGGGPQASQSAGTANGAVAAPVQIALVEEQAAPAQGDVPAAQPRSQRSAGRDGSTQDGQREQQPRVAHQQNQGGKKQHKGKNGSNGGGSGQGGRQYQKGAYSQQASGSREYNPGNGSPGPSNGSGMSNNGGARRKTKVRRTAPSFVGPMDHSYRVVNGNIADGSPSTMDYRSNANGNGNGNGYSRVGYAEAVEVQAPVVLRSDAPTRILCFIEELFVVARMQEHARKLGVKVGFCKAEKETVASLMDLPEADRPSLIIFDLNNANAKPLTLIPKLKAKLKRGTSIIGYLSHIQGDLKLKAMEAGCDTVMPKSAFSQNLPNLLRRHGLEEEVEALEV